MILFLCCRASLTFFAVLCASALRPFLVMVDSGQSMLGAGGGGMNADLKKPAVSIYAVREEHRFIRCLESGTLTAPCWATPPLSPKFMFY